MQSLCAKLFFFRRCRLFKSISTVVSKFSFKLEILVGETDAIFIAHGANRGEIAKYETKPLKMAAYKLLCRGFQPLEFSLETIPKTCVLGYKYIAIFNGFFPNFLSDIQAESAFSVFAPGILLV